MPFFLASFSKEKNKVGITDLASETFQEAQKPRYLRRSFGRRGTPQTKGGIPTLLPITHIRPYKTLKSSLLVSREQPM